MSVATAEKPRKKAKPAKKASVVFSIGDKVVLKGLNTPGEIVDLIEAGEGSAKILIEGDEEKALWYDLIDLEPAPDVSRETRREEDAAFVETVVSVLGREVTPETKVSDSPASKIIRWAIDKVVPNPWQPRHAIPQADIEAMRDSIAEHGILHAPGARISSHPEIAEIFDGETRWRAAMLNGDKFIDLAIREVSDLQMAVFALESNNERNDVNPIDTALAYKRLADEFGLSPSEIGERDKGRSRSAVANTMRLLELPELVQELIREGKLSEAHGRALLQYKAFPAFVEWYADTIIVEDIPSKKVESGEALGYNIAHRAEQKKLLVSVDWKLKSKSKEFIKKHPGCWLTTDWDGRISYCLDVPLYKRLSDEFHKKEREEAERQAAKDAARKAAGTDGSKSERAEKIAQNRAIRAQCVELRSRVAETTSIAAAEKGKALNTVEHAALVVACYHAFSNAGQAAIEAAVERIKPKPSEFSAEEFFKLQGSQARREALMNVDSRFLVRLVAEAVIEQELVDAKKYASTNHPYTDFFLEATGTGKGEQLEIPLTLEDSEAVGRTCARCGATAGVFVDTKQWEALPNGVQRSNVGALATPHGAFYCSQCGPEVTTCRSCGCTDENCSLCVEKTGGPCSWVEPDLCSACADGGEVS